MTTRVIGAIVAFVVVGSAGLWVVVESNKDYISSEPPEVSESLIGFETIKRTQPAFMKAVYDLEVEFPHGQVPKQEQLEALAYHIREVEKTVKANDSLDVAFHAPGDDRPFALARLQRDLDLVLMLKDDVIRSFDESQLNDELRAARRARRLADKESELKAKERALDQEKERLLAAQQRAKQAAEAKAEAERQLRITEREAAQAKAAAEAKTRAEAVAQAGHEAPAPPAADEADVAEPSDAATGEEDEPEETKKEEKPADNADEDLTPDDVRANRFLEEAKGYIERNRSAQAKRRLKLIVNRYPDTEAAKEAQRLLRGL